MHRRRVPPEAGIGRPPLPLPSPGARVPTPLPPPDRLEPWPASRVCSGWGGGWVVGWGFEPHSRATLGFLSRCWASGGGGEPQRVRGCRSGIEGDGGGGGVPRRVMGPPRVVWVTGRVHPAFGQNASTTTTSWSMPSRAIAARPAWSTGWRLSRASMETAERAEDRIPVMSRTF